MSEPCDGFRLAYDLIEGDGPAMVLLHGWPGTRHDYREVIPLLAGSARVVVPDLRGFGDSDKHRLAPTEFYTQDAQVRSVLALMDELNIQRAIFGGYDVGSRVLLSRLSHKAFGLRRRTGLDNAAATAETRVVPVSSWLRRSVCNRLMRG